MQTAVPTAPRRDWLHRLVNFAVAVVVLAVAAGTFFLSYPGVHAIARQGGVSGQLARFYPALFDAVLVIACVAAVMLRDARWWARSWAWLVAIVILGAIGTTDVLHAMSYGLRQRPTEGVVAAAPVAAVLLAFSLFLTMLRQSRPQPTDAAPGQAPRGPADGGAAEQPTAPMMFSNVETIPALAAGAVTRPPAPPIALPAAPADAWPVGQPAADLRDDDVDQAADAPAAVTETPDTTPTQEIPALAADPSDADQDSGTAATAEEPALAATAAEAPDTTHLPTEQNEAVGPPAPPLASGSEPTEELTPVPTPEPPAETADEVSDESADEVSDEPEPQSAQASPPQSIRYASSAAAEQFGDEDWEAEVDPALAGQVYPVLTSDPDIEVPPHQPGQPQDLEDDAPPFATAPFASVPRLNRVRVTPTPPTDDPDAE
jgi:Protein of unknown function (DUF2637)